MLNNLKLFRLILDTSKQNALARILIEKGLTVSVAESCTGGLLSSLLTDVSGSSSFIKCNFVTYANEAKMKYLNVKEETLNRHGAVSIEVANEMVQGLLDCTSSDFTIATTGIAGPTGGTEEKPVGLIYIGVGAKDNIKVFKYNVDSKLPRILVKHMFAKHAISLLHDFIKEQK